jgi:hypothetical protein
VAQGRAECVYTRQRGKRGATVIDEALTPTGRRWRCRRYALKSCPQTIDLSGAPKRINWRSEPVVKKRRTKA